jgi:hypothetical protein
LDWYLWIFAIFDGEAHPHTSKMSARFTVSTLYDTPQTWKLTGRLDTSWNLTNCVRSHSYYPSNVVHGAESILRRLKSVSSCHSVTFGTLMFITIFTKSGHLSIPWASQSNSHNTART